jgi:hypothetical protein
MKTLILSLVLFLTFISCSKNDDSTTPQENNPIVATWKLVKFEPGFSPISNYNGEILWTFNSNNTISVVIQNGTNVNNTLPLNENGDYNFTINNNQIIINSITYKFEIVNNVLKIEDLLGQSSDGKKLTLNKIL